MRLRKKQQSAETIRLGPLPGYSWYRDTTLVTCTRCGLTVDNPILHNQQHWALDDATGITTPAPTIPGEAPGRL